MSVCFVVVEMSVGRFDPTIHHLLKKNLLIFYSFVEWLGPLGLGREHTSIVNFLD